MAFTDDFNRSTTGSEWDWRYTTGADAPEEALSGNQVLFPNATLHLVRTSAESDADHYAQCVVTNCDSFNFVAGPTVRASADGSQGYCALAWGGRIQVKELQGDGSLDTVLEIFDVSPNGSTVKAVAEGTLLSIYIDDVLADTYTMTLWGSNTSTGILGWNANADDFEAGGLSADATADAMTVTGTGGVHGPSVTAAATGAADAVTGTGEVIGPDVFVGAFVTPGVVTGGEVPPPSITASSSATAVAVTAVAEAGGATPRVDVDIVDTVLTGTGEVPTPSLAIAEPRWRYSDPQLVTLAVTNEGTATAGDLSRTVQDFDSIELFGVGSKSVSLLSDSREDAFGVASSLVLQGATPRLAFRSIRLSPGPTGEWGFALGVRVFDRVRLERHPHSIGDPEDDEYRFEGLEAVINPGRADWSFSIFATLADDPNTVGLWDRARWDADTNGTPQI